MASSADRVVLDLEDAVAPSAKENARDARGRGAISVDGKLVDKPLIDKAQRLIAQGAQA